MLASILWRTQTVKTESTVPVVQTHKQTHVVALPQCPAQFVMLTGFALEQLPTDMTSSSFWISQTLRTLPVTHSDTQGKGYGLKRWSVQQNGLALLDLVTLLTYKICSIRWHQLSQCPGEERHASSCVCYLARYVVINIRGRRKIYSTGSQSKGLKAGQDTSTFVVWYCPFVFSQVYWTHLLSGGMYVSLTCSEK